jgi:restriction system protein
MAVPDYRLFYLSDSEIPADKCVILTTSTFTRDAESWIGTISKKVVSIDGEKMADLMFQHNLGVEIVDTHEIKKVS